MGFLLTNKQNHFKQGSISARIVLKKLEGKSYVAAGAAKKERSGKETSARESGMLLQAVLLRADLAQIIIGHKGLQDRDPLSSEADRSGNALIHCVSG